MIPEPILQRLVGAARESARGREPVHIGDLVVATEGCPRVPPIGILEFDPDAIGWLVAHGDAPMNADGSGLVREVWDIRPISGRPQQRWENVTFSVVSPCMAALVAALLGSFK